MHVWDSSNYGTFECWKNQGKTLIFGGHWNSRIGLVIFRRLFENTFLDMP
jgi:hypothetical protein